MSSKQVTTGTVRSSYLNVFRPRMNDLSNKEEYSMMLLIPKTETATVERIKAACGVAATEFFKGKLPPNMKTSLRDGDVEKAGEEIFAGQYFMNIKSKNKPGVVDANVQPIIDESQFKSGDYCRVNMNAYAYDQKGNKGVAFGLGSVQKIMDGEALGGSAPRPEECFAAVEGGQTFDETVNMNEQSQSGEAVDVASLF